MDLQDSGAEAVGRKAYATLEGLVRKRWEHLAPAEKRALRAWSAERFLLRVWWHVARLKGEATVRIPRQTVRPVRGPLVHRGIRKSASRELVLHHRSFDSREQALSDGRQSFTLVQLEALQKLAIEMAGDIRRLNSTPLGSRQRGLSRRLASSVVRVLNAYARRSLPRVIRQAEAITERDQADTRRIVVTLISEIKSVTGNRHLQLVADFLNWRAPREGDWTPRLLRRWLAEGTDKKSVSIANRQESITPVQQKK